MTGEQGRVRNENTCVGYVPEIKKIYFNMLLSRLLRT